MSSYSCRLCLQDENHVNSAGNALERGRAFAEAGLLAAAASEFRKYLKQNLNSETTKKCLRQILEKGKNY